MTRSHPEANFPCDCRTLDSAADEPDIPIIFSANTNEYQLVHGDDNQSRMLLYYCPFCGGRTPDSRRDRLFSRITMAETDRLKELTRGIKTIDDAIRLLGTPDTDSPDGVTIVTDGSETDPTKIESYRTITYSGLSVAAVVHITDYRGGGIQIQFFGKSVEDRQSTEPAEKPVRTKDATALRDQKAGRTTVYCSFCGQSGHSVPRMLQSHGAAICIDCAESFTR